MSTYSLFKNAVGEILEHQEGLFPIKLGLVKFTTCGFPFRIDRVKFQNLLFSRLIDLLILRLEYPDLFSETNILTWNSEEFPQVGIKKVLISSGVCMYTPEDRPSAGSTCVSDFRGSGVCRGCLKVFLPGSSTDPGCVTETIPQVWHNLVVQFINYEIGKHGISSKGPLVWSATNVFRSSRKGIVDLGPNAFQDKDFCSKALKDLLAERQKRLKQSI